MVALCGSDLGGGDWLVSYDSWSNGGWAAESCIHGLSSRGRTAGVGLEERLLTVVVAATAGDPQSVTGGGPDEGRRYLK